MASYPTTTYNGSTFAVSSEPMPSRIVTKLDTTGTARLMTILASPYETSLQTFEKAILGSTIPDPINTDRLIRKFPHTWPLHTQGALDAIRMRLPSSGRVANPDGTPSGGIIPAVVNNPSTDSYWPSSPFAFYDVDYGPLDYSRFLSDTAAYAGMNPPKELGRMILVLEQPQPRELRVPDSGFIRSDTLAPVLTVGFVPFYQSEVRYIWRQVPYDVSIPWQTIEDSYLKVNSVDFDGDELHTGWPAGTLLFRKIIDPDNFYFGPGGLRYVDLQLCFDYVPGGWNYALVPSGSTYVYVAILKKATSQPPYASVDFAELFNPGNP